MYQCTDCLYVTCNNEIIQSTLVFQKYCISFYNNVTFLRNRCKPFQAIPFASPIFQVSFKWLLQVTCSPSCEFTTSGWICCFDCTPVQYNTHLWKAFVSRGCAGTQWKRQIHPEVVKLPLGLHSHLASACKNNLKGIAFIRSPLFILLASGNCPQQTGGTEDSRTAWIWTG